MQEQITIPHVRTVERLHVAPDRLFTVELPAGIDEVMALHQMADECDSVSARASYRAGLLRRAAYLISQGRTVNTNAIRQ
jgi:hypothetical protein